MVLNNKILFLMILFHLIYSAMLNAQQLPSYDSELSIANPTENQSYVEILGIQENSNQVAFSRVVRIPPKSVRFFGRHNLSEFLSFKGSIIVSAELDIGAVLTTYGVNQNKKTASTYVGQIKHSNEIFLPLLMKDNGTGLEVYNTWYAVHNLEQRGILVDITYSDGTSRNKQLIYAGSTRYFHQKDEFHPEKVFSAKIVGPEGSHISAAVLEENKHGVHQFFAYSGVISSELYPMMPLINSNNSDFVTGVQIMNIGDTETKVTMEYKPDSNGTQCNETQSIPANASKTFTLGVFEHGEGNTNCVAKQKFIGSARVTSNIGNNSHAQPLLAVVNQLRWGKTGEAYNAYGSSYASRAIVFPLVYKTVNDRSRYWSGMTLLNTTHHGSTVRCEFLFEDGRDPVVFTSEYLTQYESWTYLLPHNQNLPPDFKGAAYCKADHQEAKIIGIINAIKTDSDTADDSLIVYEGIPVGDH